MTKMGFLAMWIDWVMSCVTTSSFYVRINGKAYGNTFPSRGLRQGDPLHLIYFFYVKKVLHLY